MITGAAQGIGRAYAKRFIEDGAKVVFCDLDDERAATTLAELGPRARYRHCDVTIKNEVDALMDFAVAEFGRLDVCVANAGVVHHANFLELEPEDFDRVMSVNVSGTFITGQSAAKRMIASGNGGSLINIASTNAYVVNLAQVPYAASKGAIVVLTKVMAVSLADHSIRVNAIAPGSVRTPMFDDVVERMPGMQEMILSRTPAASNFRPQRDCRGGEFPRLRRRQLHHRPDHHRRWRPHRAQLHDASGRLELTHARPPTKAFVSCRPPRLFCPPG